MATLKDNIIDFDHIGIPCRDIEETKSWYVEQLGFELIHEPTVEIPEGSVKVAFLKHGSLMLEFYQLLGADYEEVLSRRDGHVDHFAVRVRDIDTAFAQAKQAELEIIDNAPIPLDFWENGMSHFKVRGPNDEIVEFLQML